MFERIKFDRSHIKELLAQESNISSAEFFNESNLNILEKLQSFTGTINGKPVVCGGIVPYWSGRGYLWSVFDEQIKGCRFIPIFRGIKAFLNEYTPLYNRLEIAVPCDFKTGLRRAKLLGFEVECDRAVKYLPDKSDCTLFVMFGGA